MSADLTVHEVAAQLGEHPETVRTLIRRGDLVARKAGLGGRTSPYRIRQAAVDEFVARREALTRSGRTA